ncbi:hypothetical protein [Gemella cuniculi]|uniref:hypothetical protein n=1 Tax=Gemella cuniculi TaxID=150240 RepID=UPI0003F8DDED|nr:hypothetical protein [Gemella cuniculi]
MFKISKKNYLFIIILFFILYFLLIDAKVWYDFFKFDINAQDLTIDGRIARNKYVLSYYDVGIIFTELYSYGLIILPIAFLPSLYFYNKFRKKLIKYAIGKTSNIKKYLLSLKFKVATIPLIIFNVIFFYYVLLSYIFRGLKTRPGANFEFLFAKDSILNFFNNSTFWFLFLYWLSHMLVIFFTSLLLTTLLDYNYNYISVFIFFYLILYIGNRFIMAYIGQYYQLDLSISWCVNPQAYLYEVIRTYIYLIVIYYMFRLFKRKEF